MSAKIKTNTYGKVSFSMDLDPAENIGYISFDVIAPCGCEHEHVMVMELDSAVEMNAALKRFEKNALRQFVNHLSARSQDENAGTVATKVRFRDFDKKDGDVLDFATKYIIEDSDETTSWWLTFGVNFEPRVTKKAARGFAKC